MIKVTIITAFYHGEKYLGNLLQMIKSNAQYCNDKGENVRIEYIIINDSPDYNISISEDFHEYFDLVLKNNDKNVGIHRTRINGLKSAQGEYVIFLDQDDVLYPNAVFSSLKCIGNADWVISNGYHSNNGIKRKIYKNRISQWMATRKIFFEYCTSMLASPGHAFIKKNIIPKSWCENVMEKNGSDDYFLWLLLLDNDAKIVMNQEFVYEHVETNQNFSLDRRKMYESSNSFCKIAEENQLFSATMLNRIVRRTNMKIKWNYGKLSDFSKIWLGVTNIDVFLVNFAYKLFY